MGDNITCGIYVILNKNNRKIYVGQSVWIEQRFRNHKRELKEKIHNNPHLTRAYHKFGKNSFEFFIIEECDESELDEKELFWINYFDSTNPHKGYNMKGGGDSIHRLSEETRKKMRENHPHLSGKDHPMYGKHLSDETKKKLSEANRGKNHWSYGLKKEQHPNYGRHHSIESREKIRESNKGLKRSPETCENIRQSQLGKKQTLKTKMKRSSVMGTTGFFRVYKKNESNKQGFTWSYRYYENGKRIAITSVDINKLKEKIILRGLEWKITDKNKAKKSIDENNKYHPKV